MILADSGYPLGGILVTMTVFFGWFLWIWCLGWVYTDLFRRKDIGGWAKTGWVIFTLVLPFIGVFVYLIVEGRAMADRWTDRAMRNRRTFDDHVRRVTGTSAAADPSSNAKAREL